MLKVVVLQKQNSAVTEDIVLEELQVFKVNFAAREGSGGVGMVGAGGGCTRG